MTAPAIHVEGMAAINGEMVFRGLRLTIPAGRWTCLLGASGVGKSTLLRILGGLEAGIDFTGRILANDDAPLAPRTILMQQDDLLLPWANVIDNTLIGARLRGDRPDLDHARELLAQAGLQGLEHRRPAELSGGQRQRVALARTLAEDRPVVLLDEPFSALDPRTRRQMQDLALRMLAGRTVVLVTHDPLEAARLGDLTVVMSCNGAEPVAEMAEPAGRSEADLHQRAAMLAGRMMMGAA